MAKRKGIFLFVLPKINKISKEICREQILSTELFFLSNHSCDYLDRPDDSLNLYLRRSPMFLYSSNYKVDMNKLERLLQGEEKRILTIMFFKGITNEEIILIKNRTLELRSPNLTRFSSEEKTEIEGVIYFPFKIRNLPAFIAGFETIRTLEPTY